MAKPKGLGKPTVFERGAKVGVYGTEGTGKTELVMSATKMKHLLVFDTEGRTQYYDPEANKGFEVIYSKDVKQAIALLEYAEELHRKGEQVAFAIDSFSSIWFEQQEVAARLGATSVGTAKFNSWGKAKAPLKQLYAGMFESPVDCIITMRAKPRYTQDKKTKKVDDHGYNVADAERGLGYAVDLIVEMNVNRGKPGTPLKPTDYWCVVTKSSGPKEENPIPTGTVIKDPSFAKLVALRLKGSNAAFEIEGIDLELLVAQERIKDKAEFAKWVAELGLDMDHVKAQIIEEHGPIRGGMMPAYVQTVWNIHNDNGKEGIPAG